MSINLSEAEIMLLTWGRWQRGNESLGYPGRNIIGRVIDEGPGASQSTARVEPHMSHIVEVVEHCVLNMNKPLQRVCKHRFIGLENDHIAAKKLRISLDVYEARVNAAIHEVAEYVQIN